MILWHASGPRAGQTFAVTGCAWRLYFQFGGAAGWLGLPIAEPVNTPDGQRQSFEGGRVTFLRAANDCSAERNAEMAAASPPAVAQPLPGTSPLDAFYDAARSDHLTAAGAGTVRTALAANYQRVGPQARVFVDEVPGGSALKLFWNEAAGDHMIVATLEGEHDAFARGYEFESSQGFVWTDPHPGAVALKQYQNGAHHWLVATPDEEAQAPGRRLHLRPHRGLRPRELSQHAPFFPCGRRWRARARRLRGRADAGKIQPRSTPSARRGARRGRRHPLPQSAPNPPCCDWLRGKRAFVCLVCFVVN